MALYAGLVRVAAYLLLLPLAHGEKVFSICLGEQPNSPTRAERALGVQTAMKVACTKEYTFEELCQIDFNVITYPQVGTLALNAFQRQPGDDAGFINHGLKPGDTGFLVCHGEPVVEVWDASSEPAEVTTVQFLEQRRRSMSTGNKNHPAVLPASCWGEFFSMEDIIGGKVFEIRKAILEDAGCHDGPFVCSCCHRRGWSPYIRGGKKAALLADADHGRGDDDKKGCTTDLASFSRLPPEDIAEKFQVFSLSNASSSCSLHGKGRHGCWAGDPAERAAGPVLYEKITTRFVAGDAEGRLEVVGHGDGEALRLDAAAARFSLLRADGTEVALDGGVCVQNRGRDLQPLRAGADQEAPGTALLQGEKYAQTPAATDAARLSAENEWLWKKLQELKGIHQAPAAPAVPAQAPAAVQPAQVASAPPAAAAAQPAAAPAAAPAAPAAAPVPPALPPPVTHVTAPPKVWVLPESVPLTAMMTDGTLTVNG